jgi:hypothetical protein
MGAPRAAAKREYHSSRLRQTESALATGPQSIRARSSHGLDLRRVFEKPRQQNGLSGGFVTPGTFLYQGGRLSYVLRLTIKVPHQDSPSRYLGQADSRLGAEHASSGNIP